MFKEMVVAELTLHEVHVVFWIAFDLVVEQISDITDTLLLRQSRKVRAIVVLVLY